MNYSSEIEEALERIASARRIAHALRDHEKLYYLATQTVVVLEELLFSLRQVAHENSKESIKAPLPIADDPSAV